MSTTRPAILRRAVDAAVAQGSPQGFATRDGSNALTASGGESRALIDANYALPQGAATTLYRNWWLWRPAAANVSDQVRILSEYDGIGQRYLTAGDDYTVNPAAAERYLLLKDHPNIWLRALNTALREECFFVRLDEWTPTSRTQTIYSTAAAPISLSNLTRKSQVWDIEYHNANEASGEEKWKPWGWSGRREWDAFDDGGVVKLDFGRRPPVPEEEMRIISVNPYAVLTDEGTTSNVDEEWAAYATLVVMGRFLGNFSNPNDPWAIIGRTAQRAARDRRRAILGKYAYRQVGRASSTVGAVGVSGRAGR